MNKLNEGVLNEVAISLAALKQSAEGDEVVVLTTDSQVGWFKVDRVVTVRGCKGGTTLTLRDIVTGDPITFALRNELPEGIARVRRVSAGINARTLKNMAAAAAKTAADTKVAPIQPVGEFENILDVPVVEEGQEAAANALPETLPAPADPEVETLPALETVTEATEAQLEAQAEPTELAEVNQTEPSLAETA